MTKFKLSILTILTVFITSSMFFSCSEEDTEPQILETNVTENLNTQSNRQLVKDLFTKGTDLNKSLEINISKARKNNISQKSNKETEAEIQAEINNYQNCSDCPSEYKNFMLPLIQDLVTVDDSELIDLINEYESNIEDYDTDELTKENIRFVLFTFKESAIYSLYNSNSMQQKVTESRVALGIAGGFLAGCATGAYLGATVGTVTVPVIGTVVGAVSGCIAAGAYQATVGAVVGGFWSLFD